VRLSFFGDSFFNGTGDDDCLGWSGRLCADARKLGLDVTMYNLGVRRDTSCDVLRRWEQKAFVRLPPDDDGRLVFSFGVNDCLHENGRPRVSTDVSVANTRTILSRASAIWPTLMIGPPSTGDASLDRLVLNQSDQMDLVCRELPAPFLPLFQTTRGRRRWQREAEQGDGIHPNRRVYQLIANAVSTWHGWKSWIDLSHVLQ